MTIIGGPTLEEVGGATRQQQRSASDAQRGWAGPASGQVVTSTRVAGDASARPAQVAETGSEGEATTSGDEAAPQSAAVTRQRELASGAAVKLHVRVGGWYRVTRAELEAAGLNPAADPARLQLYADGVELPVRLDATQWPSGGALEFYGQGLDTTSADTRVYWLVEGDTQGRRISAPGAAGVSNDDAGGVKIAPRLRPLAGPGVSRLGAPVPSPSKVIISPPPPPPTAVSFAYTVERRERSVYFSSLLNGEAGNFFGRVITNTPGAQTLDVIDPDPETAGDPVARLEVALQGVTAGAHRVFVTFNGHEAGVLDFNGRERHVAVFDVPTSLVVAGGNEVRLTSNGPGDISLTDHIRLTYPRLYRAESDALQFTAGAGTDVRVTGFTTRDVRVIDFTDPHDASELPVSVEQEQSLEGEVFAVRVRAGGTAGVRRLLAFSNERARRVAGAGANQPSDLHGASHEADLVVLTHRAFRAAADQLAARRASEGLAVAVVDVEDVYDEFSFGAHSPEAVRDFLSAARALWRRAPRYALLVGDGSYDPRNHLGRGAFDFVPSKQIDTAQMETASDEWLADSDGDGLAEMSVGRLPVRTGAEAALVVSKIVGHTPGAAERRLLLVSDRRGADGFDFEAASRSLLAHVPAGYESVLIDRGARDGATVRGEIVGGVNAGPAVVNYVGHGSVGVWTGDGLLRSSDALALTNGARLPLFVMMTCLNGYYADPSLDSLSESLLKAEGGGAVAAWTSTGMTEPDAQAEMNRALYRALFEGGGALRLGDALRAARASTADADVRRTWVLIGDPSMPWR